MTTARVVLDCVDEADPDRLLLELQLGADGLPTGHACSFGVCGSLTDPAYRFPIMFKHDGEIDFGSGFENAADRYWNLRWGGRVAVGERAVVTVDGEEYGYVIRRVDPVV